MANDIATIGSNRLHSSGMPGDPVQSRFVQHPQYGLNDLIGMAELVASSHIIPGVDTKAAAFTLMMICQAQGLHPGEALTRYHIIENRPTMRADAMQAEFQRRGGIIRWKEWTREVCRAVYLHPVHAPEPGIEITTTLAEIMQSGEAMKWDKDAPNDKGGKGALALKTNYRSMPHKMLRARNVSEGVRMVLPGVVAGIYTPEEIQDGFSFGGSGGAITSPVREPPSMVVDARVVTILPTPLGTPVMGRYNSHAAKSGQLGQVGPSIPDPEFAAKVAKAETLPGIARDTTSPTGIPAATTATALAPVDYTPSPNPIREDQKRRLMELAQQITGLHPHNWRPEQREWWAGVLLPYRVSSMAQLTAIDAATIISGLEAGEDGLEVDSDKPSSQEDNDLMRSMMVAKAEELAAQLGWDAEKLAEHCGMIPGLQGADQQLLTDLITDLETRVNNQPSTPVTGDSETSIPDAVRPAPKRTRKPKQETPSQETVAATEPTREPAIAQQSQ